ncbi:DEAD/DEAH box helicase [Pseudorhodobacter sp.]|uniref:DEAD/DEAH box helicase n=1 Tax=Pseudorhodobacter sp. TaxID=1934400 RepID=UPI002648A494|nr:DEAD/DEAH box helicase [Pseudorhodobacter sp.]MDN5788270.1 DEAD/DEAH box helicase [Pseudorhodobacter sp.]
MTKFSDLALDPRVLKAVAEAGYETPTPIQAQAIPHALEGRDVLGIAQTGTGKTASFTLPMITLLGKGRARARMPRSLVLAPTRELAAQVAENFEIYAKYTKLTKALLIGGVAFGEQDKLIDRGVDVLIATPGRLLDHFERGKLLLQGVQIMVVDEADRMLDMGFIPDIEKIFSLTPFTRQTFFYSATMAPEIERITNTFLSAAVKIEVARENSTSEKIEQRLIEVKPSRKDRSFAEKRAVLRAIIRAEGAACTNAIIFCNRKTDVDVVYKSLKQHGFNASPIHGDLDQSVRTRTLDGFRDGTVHLLVASDVAARGLDIPAVSHVFNFDVPTHPEDYVHRIGRTGRAGREGKAFTLATPSDAKYLTAIETLVSRPIPRGELPAGIEVGEERPRRAKAADAEKPERRSRSRKKPDATAELAVDAGAVSDAPATKDDAPRPERTRSRNRRSDRNEDRGEPVAEASSTAQAALPQEPDVVDGFRDSRRDEGNGDRRDDRRDRDTRREDRSDDRRDRDDRRGNRNDNRRGNGGNGGNDRVVGMGDHVPDFILRSFRLDTETSADEAEVEPALSDDSDS